MNDALVYISAIGFFIAIFPVHIINYIYVSSESKYASVNVTLYRLFTLANINSDKRLLKDEKKVAKSNKSKSVPKNWLELYNKLCITKIVQLGDYGVKSSKNIYIALTQNAITEAIYAFVKVNGGRTKLRNYTVLNYEHDSINFYLKLTGIINVITLSRLFLIFIWGKLSER